MIEGPEGDGGLAMAEPAGKLEAGGSGDKCGMSRANDQYSSATGGCRKHGIGMALAGRRRCRKVEEGAMGLFWGVAPARQI